MMRLRRTVVLAVLMAAAFGWSAAPARIAAQVTEPAGIAAARLLPDLLPRRTSALLTALDRRFDERAAMDLVTFMDRYWRNAGNAGFNASIGRIRERLAAGGFGERGHAAAAPGPVAWIEEYPAGGHGWDYTVGTLTLLGENGAPDEVLLSRDRQRVALCINSFATPDGGLTARIVDVGGGASPADYDKGDVRGAIVLGDASAGRLWQNGVVQRGAIGVVSTSLAPYVRPGWTEADLRLPRDQWDVLQWGSVPYDEGRRAFGFKATPLAAARIRARLKNGTARARVEVASTFADLPARTLVAEIPGAVAPAERVVFAAHVQEPGANDDASGCASLVELARAIRLGIRDGAIAPPARTLTFLWVDEIRGSRRWVTDHPEAAKNVRYMFSLDMTGEDPSKTGGPFLIEKAPDPTAVWARPSDPHTEWGESETKAESLKGTLLNDVFLAVCLLRAKTTGWVVRTNPYEGGSDHSVFLADGVPAVLAWHFPDRFYHTSLDRPDKTSPAEMRHVGISVAAAGLLLAGAPEADAMDVAGLIEAAARGRLALEDRQGRTLLPPGGGADHEAAVARERAVHDAWVRWYAEALRAVPDLLTGPASPALTARIDQAVARISGPPTE